MVTLIKGGDTKNISKESTLLPILLKQGWAKKTEGEMEDEIQEKKELINVKPRKSRN